MQYGNQDVGGVERGWATPFVIPLISGKLEYDMAQKQLMAAGKERAVRAKQEADAAKARAKSQNLGPLKTDLENIPGIYEAINANNQRRLAINSNPKSQAAYAVLEGSSTSTDPEVLALAQEAAKIDTNYRFIKSVGENEKEFERLRQQALTTQGGEPFIIDKAVQYQRAQLKKAFSENGDVVGAPNFSDSLRLQRSIAKDEDRVYARLKNESWIDGYEGRDPQTGEFVYTAVREIPYEKALAAVNNVFGNRSYDQFGYESPEAFEQYKEDFARTITTRSVDTKRRETAQSRGAIGPNDLALVEPESDSMRVSFPGGGDFDSRAGAGYNVRSDKVTPRTFTAEARLANGQVPSAQVDGAKARFTGARYMGVDRSGRFTTGSNDPSTVEMRAFRLFQVPTSTTLSRDVLQDPEQLATIQGTIVTPDGRETDAQEARNTGQLANLLQSAAQQPGTTRVISNVTVFEPINDPNAQDFQQAIARERETGRKVFASGTRLTVPQFKAAIGQPEGAASGARTPAEFVDAYLRVRNPPRNSNIGEESYGVFVELNGQQRRANLYRNGTVTATYPVKAPDGTDENETVFAEPQDFDQATGTLKGLRPVNVYRHKGSYSEAKSRAQLRRVGGQQSSAPVTPIEAPAPARSPQGPAPAPAPTGTKGKVSFSDLKKRALQAPPK
jgi:hypothetical protein